MSGHEESGPKGLLPDELQPSDSVPILDELQPRYGDSLKAMRDKHKHYNVNGIGKYVFFGGLHKIRIVYHGRSTQNTIFVCS